MLTVPRLMHISQPWLTLTIDNYRSSTIGIWGSSWYATRVLGRWAISISKNPCEVPNDVQGRFGPAARVNRYRYRAWYQYTAWWVQVGHLSLRTYSRTEHTTYSAVHYCRSRHWQTEPSCKLARECWREFSGACSRCVLSVIFNGQWTDQETMPLYHHARNPPYGRCNFAHDRADNGLLVLFHIKKKTIVHHQRSRGVCVPWRGQECTAYVYFSITTTR
jgi:hypothetical protein